jgi:hypothetical protein
MRSVVAQQDGLIGGCGVSTVYNFRAYTSRDEVHWSYKEISKLIPSAGCGWVIVAFVAGDPLSEQAYELCKQRGPVVYQSPVRVNKNSENDFYFAVFDWSDGEYGFAAVARSEEGAD